MSAALKTLLTGQLREDKEIESLQQLSRITTFIKEGVSCHGVN